MLRVIINKTISLAMICVLLTSCMARVIKETKYTEEFQNFLITEDKTQIVILGKEYHYIFPVSDDLRSIISWKNSNKITLNPYSLKVSRNNIISGNYSLIVNKESITKEQQEWLISNGFKDAKKNMLYTSRIEGKRYIPNKNINYTGNSTNHFFKIYKVTITEELKPGAKAVNIAATPVIIVAGGAVVVTFALAGAALLAIPMAIGCMSQNKTHSC